MKSSSFKLFLQRYGRFVTVIVLAGVIGVAALIVNLNHQAKRTYKQRSACSILTPDIARRVGGTGLQSTPLKSTSDTTTVTTFCVYRGSNNSVALVVRSPKNKAGAELNHQAFSSPPVSSQVVRGYGDDAYWTPSLAQLNIRKHDTWYLLSNGSNTTSQRTLTQAQKLADAISQRL